MSMPCWCHQQRALCGPAKFGRSPASRRVLALPRSRPGSLWRARAGAEGGETSAGPSLTLEEAYSVLGVKEGVRWLPLGRGTSAVAAAGATCLH